MDEKLKEIKEEINERACDIIVSFGISQFILQDFIDLILEARYEELEEADRIINKIGLSDLELSSFGSDDWFLEELEKEESFI